MTSAAAPISSRSSRGGAYAVAHRLTRASGEERMMLCRGHVYRDPHGEPLRMVGTSLDLTEYMGVAEELRVRHDHLLAVEELAGTGSFEYDLIADRATWSDGMYRLFRLRRDEYDGTVASVIQRVHPGDRERFREDVERLFRSGAHLEVSTRITRGDATTAWIGARIEVKRSPEGEAVRAFGVCWELAEGSPGD